MRAHTPSSRDEQIGPEHDTNTPQSNLRGSAGSRQENVADRIFQMQEEKRCRRQKLREMFEEAEWKEEYAMAEADAKRRKFDADRLMGDFQNEMQMEENKNKERSTLKMAIAEEENKNVITMLSAMEEKKKDHFKKFLACIEEDRDKKLQKEVDRYQEETMLTVAGEMANDVADRKQLLEIMKETRERERELKKVKHVNTGELHKWTIAHENLLLKQKLQEMKQKQDSDLKFRQEASQKELMFNELDQKNQAHEENTRRATVLKTQRRRQYEQTKKALGLSTKELLAQHIKTLQGNFTKLFFLIIVLACEIDTFGFMLSVQYYGKIGIENSDWLMLASLSSGPISYVVAIVAYQFYLKKEGAPQKGSDPDVEAGRKEETDLPDEEKLQLKPKGFNQLKRSVRSEKFRMDFYHYIPFYRSYILMKEQSADDVEALFRINGLSTFTLGFNQLFCLMLTYLKNYAQQGGVIQQIIYANQGFNLAVTLLYFSSSIAGRMKGMTKVESMRYNLRERMQRDILRYQCAVDQDALHTAFKSAKKECDPTFGTGECGDDANGMETKVTVRTFHLMMEKQIAELAALPEIDMSPFSIEEKFQIRKQLCMKQINAFVDATAV